MCDKALAYWKDPRKCVIFIQLNVLLCDNWLITIFLWVRRFVLKTNFFHNTQSASQASQVSDLHSTNCTRPAAVRKNEWMMGKCHIFMSWKKISCWDPLSHISSSTIPCPYTCARLKNLRASLFSLDLPACLIVSSTHIHR
jgi:hypothetical protein